MAQAVIGRPRRAIRITMGILIVIVLGFFAVRLVTDVPFLVRGVVPSRQAFEYRYITHPALGYVHIVPGVLYLVLAPFQLSRRFRSRNPARHRLIGRIIVPAALLSGVLALAVGIVMPYGGPVETSASTVFGLYFLTALVLALRAVRRHDITAHRRWMIRAFAIAVGIGTIRIWVGVFELLGWLAIQDDAGRVWFGVAFWLAFGMHAAAAQLYLRARPAVTGAARARTAARPA